MKGVTRFVRKGQHVPEGIVISHEDTRVFGQHGAGAKAPRPFAGSRFPIHPVFANDQLLKKLYQPRICTQELTADGGGRIIPGKDLFIRQNQWPPEIEPGNTTKTDL
jgi:hypothetical protein